MSWHPLFAQAVCRRSAWLLQQSTVRCQRRTPATSAECSERGSTVHHWYSEIRSHHASVAQPSLVASATKDNFQDRHSDVPMFCLNGLAPSYLAADCIVVSAIPGRRQLRSVTSGQLYIPRTRTVTFGPRSFKVCGPTIWNDLPARMKDPSLSFDSFRKMLKTFLFDKWLLHERICGSCINLRGDMFLIIIIIIIIIINNNSSKWYWDTVAELRFDQSTDCN